MSWWNEKHEEDYPKEFSKELAHEIDRLIELDIIEIGRTEEGEETWRVKSGKQRECEKISKMLKGRLGRKWTNW